MDDENRRINRNRLLGLLFSIGLILLLMGLGAQAIFGATTQKSTNRTDAPTATPTEEQTNSTTPTPKSTATLPPTPTTKSVTPTPTVALKTPTPTPRPSNTPIVIKPGAAVSPLLLGTNLNLHTTTDPVLTSPATQTLLGQTGAGILRIPTPDELSDATLTKAAQVVKNMGAKPVVILDGDAIHPNALENDKRIIQIMNSVFPGQVVYYEYGNEQDFFGPISQEKYTESWNRVIPELKKLAPTGHFIGPVNYQFNPVYLEYFLKNANPLPNEVSWHEYTCGDEASWTKETCIQRIDNWSVHFAKARAVMTSAIGTTLPIMISEWNYTANPLQSGGKYTDNEFIINWTTKALQNLAANGIFAAMQYASTSYPIALINGDNTLSVQGKVFQAHSGQSGG
jgi:hypothetical protein